MKLLTDEKTFLKALVYGRSGTGKTTLGVTAKNPLILLSERQGLVSVRAQAKRIGIKDPSTLHMDSAGDYRIISKALAKGPVDGELLIRPAREAIGDKPAVAKLALPWPDTVVVDSLTDVARLVEDGLDKEAPMPISDKDGLPIKDMRRWGELMKRFRKIVLEFREAPVDVLFLCLLEDKTEGEGSDAVRMVYPTTITKSISEQMPSHVNLMGTSERHADGDGGFKFVINFSGPNHTVFKTMDGVNAVEEPNFANIAAKVAAAQVTETAKPKPKTQNKKSA